MLNTTDDVDAGHAASAAPVIELLQQQLDMLNDLALTLKHAHWNVTGPHFIAVHTMLDPQVASVRDMADDVAERIAAMGGCPDGRIGGIVSRRRWNEYSLGTDDALEHLAALETVYARVVSAHRQAATAAESDVVVQDLLTAQSAQLEKFSWFVAAHSRAGRPRG